MPVISEDRFQNAFQWTDYMAHIEKNVERFNDNYEEFNLAPDDAEFFSNYSTRLNVLIIAEDWCGDVVQSLPPIIRILERSPSIQIGIIKRDENLDIMDQYLTNGSKSIPYLVFMDTALNERAQWGPRPKDCQNIMTTNKGKIPMDEIYPQLRAWYKENGNDPLVRELREVLEQLV